MNIISKSIVMSAVALLTGCTTLNPIDLSNSRIRVKAFVDGCDVVKIRGDQVWIVHKAYTFPGKWDGCNEPVVVNGGEKWFPEWNGTVSDRYTIKDKDRALPLNVAFSPETMDVKVKSGLGNFFVSEYPAKDNNYTLVITLDDRAADGASWHEIGVDWN